MFQSFFMAGFECSTHRRPDGLRLDLAAGTRHDRLAAADFRLCVEHGISTARDGLRWHLIGAERGRYDWSSWIPMLEAAAAAGVEVIWDLFHYGSPDWLDRGGSDFAGHFADFAVAAVRVHRAVTGRAARVVPVNEISFFAWAVRTGYFPPAGPDEKGWFKRHLVRTAIAGATAMRAADPEVLFFSAEPLIHIDATVGAHEEAVREAEAARQAQFEATDLLLGLAEPELGGGPDMIDAVGLNFYPDNQWFDGGSTIPLGHHRYRPLSQMLGEAARRYGKPVFLAETMAEGSARAAWLSYVGQEVREAIRAGVDCRGICLYPVTNYPGWDDLRHADVGLFSAAPEAGQRNVDTLLAEELARQQALFGAGG